MARAPAVTMEVSNDRRVGGLRSRGVATLCRSRLHIDPYPHTVKGHKLLWSLGAAATVPLRIDSGRGPCQAKKARDTTDEETFRISATENLSWSWLPRFCDLEKNLPTQL